MVDLRILDAFGSTDERLKEIFTAEPDPGLDGRKGTKEERASIMKRKRQLAEDILTRQRFQRRIQTRVEEGIVHSLKNWRLYAAIDLAWDTATLNRMTIPLLMYAQGKVNVEKCAHMLEGTRNADCIKKDKDGKVEGIDVPKFVESNFNLVRSIIGRRHAAQKNKYNNLWPYYDYESRSTGLVGKCRADVLSQRVDIMADQYDYRHHDSQVIRDAMLYGHVFDFPVKYWDVKKQWRMKAGASDPRQVEDYVEKEGIPWSNPHPSRVFCDNSRPRSTINTNTGVKWLGFWDLCRFSAIEDNPHYFNKRVIGWTGKFWGDGGVVQQYTDYFTHYSYTILPPQTGEIDLSKANDRVANIGIYSGNYRDASVFLTHYYEEIIPVDYNIGTYPHPVWVHFAVASNNTVVFAEFLPTTPSAVLSIGESDNRQVNVSLAHEIMPHQDAMSNLLTHMLLMCQVESFKVIGLNLDVIDAESIKEIKRQLHGKNWATEPLVLAYSLAKLEAAGVKPNEAIHIAETRQGATISSLFEAMIRLVTLTEKLLALSPAEQGQPAPREISATEVSEIANTTQSIYSSISADINEWRAAKKRMIYETLVTCQSAEFVCPVKRRYTEKTIRAAGFKPVEGEDEDIASDARRRTVIGTAKNLIADVIFTTRDGDERAVNTQAANTLVQLVGLVLSTPAVARKLGREKLYDLFNEIFRMSGAGFDLVLEMDEGETNDLGEDELKTMQQAIEQIGQMLNQLAAQTKKNAEDVAGQAEVNRTQEQAIGAMRDLAGQVKHNANAIKVIEGRHGEIQRRLTESISYKDAPDDIRRQMEMQAGFQPSVLPPKEPAKK